MTIGVAIAAHQVLTFRAYGLDEALLTGRLQSPLRVEGMTSGKSDRKSIATAPTMETPDRPNDHPSRPAWLAMSAATSAATATTRATRLLPSPLSTCVHSRKSSASTAAARPTHVASFRARTRMSPTVLSAVNTAPWKVNSVRVTSPPSSAYGL